MIKKFFILSFIVSISFGGNIDAKKYKNLMDSTTKEAFGDLIKNAESNAKANFNKMSQDDHEMNELYGFKNKKVGFRDKQLIQDRFVSDKLSYAIKISNLQKQFIDSKDLNELFDSILELRVIFTNKQPFTKDQLKVFKRKLKNKSGENKSSAFLLYKLKFISHIEEIENCYLNAKGVSDMRLCNKSLNELQYNSKTNRFIKNYMEK